MAKAKIQSKVSILYDSIDRIWGKLIVEMKLDKVHFEVFEPNEGILKNL